MPRYLYEPREWDSLQNAHQISTMKMETSLSHTPSQWEIDKVSKNVR